MKSIVIVVFVKDDLIERQINNLLALENIDEYNVIFYQDSTYKSPKYDTKIYLHKLINVKDIILKNLHRFKNSEYKASTVNIMPFGLCKLSLDYAFNERNQDFCIFLEDDVFLSKNALHWFNYVYNNKLLSWDTYKFATGESIYYDTHSMKINPPNGEVDNIKKNIQENTYQKYYYEINNFITSSIFATTNSIWNTEIRDLRGMVNGECELNNAIYKNNWKSIFPVLPFAKDIGMTHDDGWSVAWHTKAGVREIKNVYIMADEFDTPDKYELLPHDFNLILLRPDLNEDLTVKKKWITLDVNNTM
jgi:hypothetical protein